MSLISKILISTAFIIANVHHAHASLVEFLDTKAMTETAEAIRIGTITRTYSSWDPENKMIYTYVKLNVSQTIKGEDAKEVLMRIPGGETNGVRMKVSGVAHFHKGEETMVFLRDHNNAPTVVGMGQGKYIVTTDQHTGKKMVSRQLPKSLEFVNQTAVNTVKKHHAVSHHDHDNHAHAQTDQPIELADMIVNVQQYVKEAKR